MIPLWGEADIIVALTGFDPVPGRLAKPVRVK
jgi:hypothetical protein